MAISQQHEEVHHSSSSFLLDALYCEEEQWEEEEEEGGSVEDERLSNDVGALQNNGSGARSPSLFPLLLLEQDLFWEDEELLSLFSKEQRQQIRFFSLEGDGFLSLARREAVEWMLKVNAHYGFSTSTAILAINYLDRFLSDLHFQKDKPWMIQLAAVTCLSLAAKVEETDVPLLLDLQVESTRYLFEAKTIQKMELLVLSTLEWKMHPVTPLSFLDHIIRRLGLKNHLHWEFLRRCESLLLSLVADSRFVGYLPSVLATATMMHVIDKIEPSNPLDYQNQLLGVLNISKGKVKECYQLIVETLGAIINGKNNANGLKRKCNEEMPSSPSGVIDGYFSCESSNDSWAVGSSVSSSPLPVMKKSRVREQHMPLPSLSRVFVDVVGSPH
ncbi:Cyclin-D3-1 [Ancistrocladus abbreviatus]